MANMYMNDSYSAVRQADGKVLGRVRAVVKSATPQAGVKAGPLIVRGAVAAALATLVTPAAALLALISPAEGDSNQCRTILSQMKK